MQQITVIWHGQKIRFSTFREAVEFMKWRVVLKRILSDILDK